MAAKIVLSQGERRQKLHKAARDYARGRINGKQFKEAERKYGLSYIAASRALARRSLDPVRNIQRIFERAGVQRT